MRHDTATDDVLPEDDREELSGRFAIDRRGVLVPPALDDVPELSQDDLSEEPHRASLDELSAELQLRTVPPPPARAMSARPMAVAVEDDQDWSQDDDREIVDPDLRDFSVTVPPPAEVSVYERAELEVEDMSLRLGNPYVASSLVPPVRKPPARLGRVLGVIAAVLLVGGGAFVLGARTAENAVAAAPAAAVAALPSSAAAVAAPAAQVQPAEPAVALAAEPPAELQAVAAAPVAVEEPVAEAPVAAAVAAVPERAEATRPSVAAAPAVEAEAAVAPEAQVAASPAAVAAALDPYADPVAAPSDAPAAEAPVAEAPAAEAAAVAAPVAEAPAADLPEAPSREQIIEGFEAVRADLLTCAAGNHGMLKSQATILGSGRVSQVLIDGVFRGTPEGSCMARTLRKAKFVAFSQPNVTISYPFSL